VTCLRDKLRPSCGYNLVGGPYHGHTTPPGQPNLSWISGRLTFFSLFNYSFVTFTGYIVLNDRMVMHGKLILTIKQPVMTYIKEL
jgi:hypothetical protein